VSSVTPSYSRKAKIRPWLIGAAGLCLAAAVSIALVPASLQWLPILLCAVAGFLGLMLWLISLIFGRVDRIIAAIRADPWVHWQFPEERWLAWAEARRAAEQKPAGRPGRRGVALALLVIAAAFAAGIVFKDSPAGIALMTIAFFALGLFLILGVALGLQWLVTGAKYRRLKAARPEVYLGRHGVLLGNEFLPFDLSSQHLTGARTEDGDLVLRFMVWTNRGEVPSVEHLPIPAEAADDLVLLQERLSQHYPRASIALAELG